MKEKIYELIEDYKLRILTLHDEIAVIGKDIDKNFEKYTRLTTKAGVYRTFISELLKIAN